MAKKYFGNAFSLQMMDLTKAHTFWQVPITPQDVPRDVESVVGHADTARFLSGILGWQVAFNRANVSLEAGDVLYVAQITGGRLPEGATELPEGVHLAWAKVTVG